MGSTVALADANSPAKTFRPHKSNYAHENAGSRMSNLIGEKKGRAHKL